MNMEEWVSTKTVADRNPEWRSILKDQLNQIEWSNSIQPIVDKILNDSELSHDDGLQLFNEPNLFEIGKLADQFKVAMFGHKAYFNSNVHINQTNVCVLACRFCAFRRGPKAEDAYELSIENYLKELEKFSPYVDEVHSVGGLHPSWTVEHYSELFERIRNDHPHISIKALTAVEIKHLAQISNLTIEKTLKRLKEAGLTSFQRWS